MLVRSRTTTSGVVASRESSPGTGGGNVELAMASARLLSWGFLGSFSASPPTWSFSVSPARRSARGVPQLGLGLGGQGGGVGIGAGVV